jgi:hypothetical protein
MNYIKSTTVVLLALFALYLAPVTSFAQIGPNPYAPAGSSATLNGQTQTNSLNGTTYDAKEGSTLYDSKQQGVYNTKQDLYNGPQSRNTSGSLTCNTTLKTFANVIGFATCIIDRSLVQIAVTLAVIYFMWGVVQYVLASGSVEERKKSKQTILWGLIAIFVIIGVWNIVKLFQTTLGF